ncbi:hypothetical protein DFJ43DRAFT_1095440 [Lentinula guzmanii]|uniref:Uncharacterized protein n=1 Tax=Lentinula guzmanii TaxID=2804957 RepID=A0AA38J4D4_9AGAR|nr:hypothetical protein DFJ43DRAFT_1095440 [Lentinula guzmanii]
MRKFTRLCRFVLNRCHRELEKFYILGYIRSLLKLSLLTILWFFWSLWKMFIPRIVRGPLLTLMSYTGVVLSMNVARLASPN